MDSISIEHSSNHSLFSEQDEGLANAAWNDSFNSAASSSQGVVLSESLPHVQSRESSSSHSQQSKLCSNTLLHESSLSSLDKNSSISLLDKSLTSLFDKSLTFHDYYNEQGEEEKSPNAGLPTPELNTSNGGSSILDKSYTFSDYYGDKEPEGKRVFEPLVTPLSEEMVSDLLRVSEHSRQQNEGEGEDDDDEENNLMINCVRGHTPPNKAVPDQIHPSSSFSVPKYRAHFANNKSISVGRMEMTIDTVIKAHEKPYAKEATRRLSFGYVLHQNFDKTTPACAIAQGWVDRMEEWDPNPTKGDKVKESKPTRLKSILKTMKKRLSFGKGDSGSGNGAYGAGERAGRGARRRSFLGTRDVQATAPKMPGRRGSFARGLWIVPVRRRSFLGNTRDETSQTDSSREDASPESSMSNKSGRKTISKRRGSFFGRACRRLSNGGRFSDGDGQSKGLASPPQKPHRRCSQDGSQVQRRGSFLGIDRRRFSSGGDKSNNPLKLPPRRGSSTVVASLD
jgi:hypothetical protein